MTVTIRRATMADASDISTLIAESARELGRSDYSADVIEAALKGAWGLDTRLLADGTYFLADADEELAAAAAGVSDELFLVRTTHLLETMNFFAQGRIPRGFAPFFVRPKFARQGLASRLLAHCEQEAINAGFLAVSLGATAPGRLLNRAFGYVEAEPIDFDLGGGLTMQVIPMSKVMERVKA